MGEPLFGDRIGKVHKWFAWFPVKTYDGRWKFLCFVERVRYQTKIHLNAPIMHWWEYR